MAFWQNIMVIPREQIFARNCNNSGETEEVIKFENRTDVISKILNFWDMIVQKYEGVFVCVYLLSKWFFGKIIKLDKMSIPVWDSFHLKGMVVFGGKLWGGEFGRVVVVVIVMKKWGWDHTINL